MSFSSITSFPNGVSSFGVPMLGGVNGIPFTGNYFFVDPVNGADGNTGSADSPLATLTAAYNGCVSGNNDVVFIIGNGSITGTVTISSAFTWAKDATHLVGITAPTGVAQRARIAVPTTGAAFANMFTVTASGCYFANFSTFDGFATGTTSQICWTDSGQRNCYDNVQFGGMGDAASAQDAGSRSLKLGGSESTFNRCTVGLDTVTRTVANASLELLSGATRNAFYDCVFPFQTSASTPLGIIVSAVAGIDRWTLFDRCKFINNVASTSTTMAGLATLPASAGGLLLMKDCTLVGITEYGTDATTRGQIYIDGGTVTAATTGIAVNPI